MYGSSSESRSGRAGSERGAPWTIMPTPPPDRRTVLWSAAGLLVPALSFGRDGDLEPVRGPLWCFDLLSKIGVNTHLSYADSQYNDLLSVQRALDYIGLKFVRDAAIDRTKPNANHYGALAAAGFRFCLYWGPRRALDEAIEQIGALETTYPGAVCGLEGPNEIKPSFTYQGLSGNDGAQAYMTEVRRKAGLNNALRKIPLVSFTSYAPASSACDFANAHPYPKMGKQPRELIQRVREEFVGRSGVMPGKPMMFTEFGYHTLVGRPLLPGQWQGVNAELQACLTINGLLDGASLGIDRIYLYQLLDGKSDPRGNNPQLHFGLFNADGSPKAAAKALKSLFAILRDDNPQRSATGNRPLDVQIDAPPTIRGLPLNHSSGRHFLALWNETPVWDSPTASPLNLAPTNVTVTVPYATPVAAFDIIEGGRKAEFGISRRIRVSIGAHPILLSIG